MSFRPKLSRVRRNGGGLAFGSNGRGGAEFTAARPLPALPFSVEGGEEGGGASPLSTSFARGAKGERG